MTTDWEALMGDLPPEAQAMFALDRVPIARDGAPMEQVMSLDGRVVLVTGGGGADLGGALCRRLFAAGAAVAVLDIDGAAASRVATALGRTADQEAIPLIADVTDWKSVRAATQRVVAEFGRIDALVNNAGGALGTHGPYATRTKSDIDSVLALNLTGVLYSTHAALEPMLEQGSGRIVTIASEGGRVAMRDLAVYNSCKAAVIAFMRNLSREVGPAGISTVSVCPGALVGPRLLERMKTYPAPMASAIVQGFDATSLGRFGLPDEVAMLVAFLVSDAGSWIHGTEISISGGQSA